MCETLSGLKDQLTDIENEEKSKSPINEDNGINLLDMPVEIILEICSYLDAYFLKNTLSKICRRLENILSDDNLWRHWVHSRIKGSFPTLPHLQRWIDEPIDWVEVCVDMDFEKKKWSNISETMKHIVVKDMHYASVDTVLLVNNGELCISGARDRSMALLSFRDVVPQNDNGSDIIGEAKPKHIREDAHSGWVWDLSPDDIDNTSTVYSASWDNSVRVWDLETFDCIEKFWCGMSVLSVVGIGKEVMAGLYSRKVLIFDQRTGTSPTTTYKAHKGPVLALHKYNNLIASVSDDKTLAIWDRVAGKLLKSDIKMPTDRAYPVCISWSPSALYVGDSRGCLHLFHPEDHTYLKSQEFWEQPPITKPPNKIIGCYQSQGNMIVCSNRGEIKFCYNCYPPEEYTTIKSSTIDITQLRYLNGVLVVGTCESTLEFWVPNDKFDNI